MTVRPALLVAAASLAIGAASPAPQTPQAVVQRLATVWNGLQSYTCTWSVHEVKGNDTQDRTYHIFFEKPLNTRAEVVAGDGDGSVAVWEGGDRVRGHQGGILKLIKLNLDIHNRLAVSLRGATIAEINIGWLLQHLQGIDPKDMTVAQNGDTSVLTAFVHDPPPDTDVVKEVDTFEPGGLPLEGFQYDANGTLLKHVIYSDYKLNVQLPDSTWQI